MQNIDSDLIRGNIDTIILKTMLKEDKYGLDIIKEVSDKSSGTYELKQPTLYSCLKRLENQELISSYWVDSEIGGKRHYYKLTDKGREFYNKKQEEWAKSKFIIDNLLSNYDYEEYRLVKKDEFDEILEKKANAPIYSNENSTEASNDSQEVLADNDNLTNEEESNNDESLDEDSLDTSSDNEDESSDEENFNTVNDNEVAETEDFETETSDDPSEVDETESNSETTDYINPDDLDSEDKDYYTENSFDISKNDENESSIDYNDIQDEENEVFELGENVNEEFEDEVEDTNFLNNSDNDDYPVYFETKQSEENEIPENEVTYETSDQSMNELNILSRLHAQDDEEINTYYGDQKSYVNHLRNLDESQLEQQDLLDSSLYTNPDEVNKSIDEFSDAVEKLNNFDSHKSAYEETENIEEDEDQIEDVNHDYPEQYNENNEYSEENNDETDEEMDTQDDLEELETLKNMSSNAFFDSDDKADYDAQTVPVNSYEKSYENNSDYEFEPEIKSSMSFEEIANEIKPIEEAEHENENTFEQVNDYPAEENNYDNNYDNDNMSEIDSIISNNITTTYTEPTQMFYKNQTTNYREKLGELSKYSRVTLEDKNETLNNEEALEKAKDIAEITKELEEEGIKIKEHYKQTSGKKLDRNYLLSNRINLMKGLILFFGYVFILSAVYIVLNNTAISDNSWFTIKPFLIGFIPFGIVLAYYLILFIINPYKKIEAKFHFRIMLFISIIVTIQLLLITYCVNLQLGFYSFTQKEYNHLYWIIPSIISFAPIIDNLIYLALFKSRNFNV